MDLPAVSTGIRAGLLAQFWRRKVLFGAVFAVTLGSVIAVMKMLPVRYSANGSIIVAEQEPAAGANSAAWVQKLGDPADLESQLLVIKSPRIIRLALARPGVAAAAQQECEAANRPSQLSPLTDLLGHKMRCAGFTADSEALLDWVDTRYAVTAAGRSRVINIGYQSTLPEVARTMANALITAYLEDQRALNAQSREATAAWLWQEVAQLDTSLRNDEAQIQAFRKENGLVRGQLAPISSERLSSASQQLSAAQSAQAEAAARLQELGRDPANSRAALDNRAIADLKQQLAAASAQTANALQMLGPNHPALAALRREEASLQGRLNAESASIAVSAQRAYAAATTQVATLTAEQQRLMGAVGTATDSEAAIASMVRAADIKRGLYVDLYKRASELETETRVLTGSTRLVSMAELPMLPFFPKTTPFLAAGLTLATLLGAIAAFLRDISDRSVRAAGGVAALTDTPVIAQIPRVQGARNALVRLPLALIPGRGGGDSLRETLAAARGSPVVQDALRSLHARLVLVGFGASRRKLLVTSAEPGEGKTFTVLALGQLIAASGRRVLVVECDLRRPMFAKALGLPRGAGLVDVLRGDATPNEAILRAGPDPLFVLPAGLPCADSTELLMSERMAQLLEWTENYDLVLIDSPPSEVLMDARVVAQRVDGVLCCTRWGQTLLSDAATAVSGLRAAGAAVVGLVVTAIDPGEHRLYDSRPMRARAYLVQG